MDNETREQHKKYIVYNNLCNYYRDLKNKLIDESPPDEYNHSNDETDRLQKQIHDMGLEIQVACIKNKNKNNDDDGISSGNIQEKTNDRFNSIDNEFKKMNSEITSLRYEFKKVNCDITSLRSEMRSEFKKVNDEISEIRGKTSDISIAGDDTSTLASFMVDSDYYDKAIEEQLEKQKQKQEHKEMTTSMSRMLASLKDKTKDVSDSSSIVSN